ncbi:class I SAM-dependent methyltransferase [Romboutsia weinsteinii]|uniref:Class I SAM-dependent methyltransferase n=1 Tax=Romboutsia weinsteinii TaxID=2020949 RepID=A0A371J9T4_9FIRM|nr:class I SAM-dependent methyltransferase [Romboutsia weinsteinii]RDY29426.1 class I SAM-dependent methyltransferase [Romboutsia weinsteinii]
MSQVDFFNSIAQNWDSIIKINESKINYLLEKLQINEDSNVLDVGTGTGVLIPFLIKLNPNGNIKAVDISNNMLEIAKNKFNHISNLSFDLVDVEEDIIDDKFDRIILYSMFPHLENKTATIKKLVENNLSNNGKLIIAHSDSRYFLNNLHRSTDDRVSESRLIEVNAQKQEFQEAGLTVEDAFENDEIYYLVISK